MIRITVRIRIATRSGMRLHLAQGNLAEAQRLIN
jgi:hypothetical protein